MLIALYNRIFEEKDLETLKKIVCLLEKQNVKLIFHKQFLEALKPHIQFKETPQYFTTTKDLPAKTHLFLSIGGDGTLLDSVTFIGASNIPIVGINLGRLGFLAAVSVEDLEQTINSLLQGAYTIEQRSLIHLVSSEPLFAETPFALNEFSIRRNDSSSMIKIHTYLNGDFLNTYWADGLIIATPTGSTGYSLSCGGPVVFPQTASFVITPVAPHNLNTRPIIIPDDTVVSFELEGRSDHFLCSLDARTVTISDNIQLAVKKEQFSISLVRPNDHNFLQTIRQKLYWGIDKRN